MQFQKRVCVVILILLIPFWDGAAQKNKNQSAPNPYETVYNKLMNLKADPNRVASVTHMVLKRDAGIFTLKNGHLYECEALNDKVHSYVFVGEGFFSLYPPNDVERGEVKRTLEKDTIGEKFTSLFLLFADTTYRDLTSSLTFVPADIPSEVSSCLTLTMKYQGDEERKSVDRELMKTLLEETYTGLFYSLFNKNGDDPYLFVINPYEDEEVRFMRREKKLVSFHNYKEVVTQFPLQTRSSDILNQKNRICVDRYALDCNITKSFNFIGKAKIAFHAQQSAHQWLTFLLAWKLDVDSVTTAAGVHLPFFKGFENYLLWIKLLTPIQRGEKDSITVFYHGDIVENEDGYVYIKSTNEWYPYNFVKVNNHEKEYYDITYHYPNRFTLVSVGRQVSCVKAEDSTSSRWVTDQPISNASFNIGTFENYRIAEEHQMPVNILVSGNGDYGINKEVGFDISNSIKFFTSVYGPCAIDSVYATEIPWWHGEAFQGLIHLANLTFLKSNHESIHTQFRAHEVSHQWWGIGVDFTTYHDQWLSEGFAEFSGLWYMQVTLKDKDKYFEMLKDWRRNILDARNYILFSGQPLGPIYLGYRNELSSTEGDYQRVVYEKSAWIMHMIRNMMIDLKTMKEDRFMAMMKEFYTTYQGKYASTEDFQHMIEKYVGQDMSWFFKQWVYGTEIPVYSFDYEVIRTPEGKFKAHCTVKTKNVSSTFKMPVPLLVKFDGERFARLRVMVEGTSCEFDLPMPLEPDKIIFNDLESVLCDY